MDTVIPALSRNPEVMDTGFPPVRLRSGQALRGNDRVRGNLANPSCRTELPEIGGKNISKARNLPMACRRARVASQRSPISGGDGYYSMKKHKK